jgi:hypothetical protein
MKKLLLILLIFVSSVVYGEKNKDYFLSPQNIQWNKTSIPQDVSTSKDFIKWKKGLLSEDPPMRWGYMSLIKEDSEEVVVQELIGGSGGLNSIVMMKKNGKWKEIATIFGGFLFAPVPSVNHDLVVYQRMGSDYSRTQYRFNGNSYKKIDVLEYPFEFSRPEMFPVDFHELFWFMNYGYWREQQNGKRK